MLKNTRQIPVPIAVLVMVLCILVGIVLGNQNALNQAIDKAGVSLTEIKELVGDRVTHAGYISRLATRNIPNDPATKALEQSILSLQSAATAGTIAAADRELTFALSSLDAPLRAVASVSDVVLLTKETDELISLERILSRAGAAYNNSLAGAQDVYNTLPSKWFLGGMPEAYR